MRETAPPGPGSSDTPGTLLQLGPPKTNKDYAPRRFPPPVFRRLSLSFQPEVFSLRLAKVKTSGDRTSGRFATYFEYLMSNGMQPVGVYAAVEQLAAAIADAVFFSVAALDPVLCGGVATAAAVGYLTLTEVSWELH